MMEEFPPDEGQKSLTSELLGDNQLNGSASASYCNVSVKNRDIDLSSCNKYGNHDSLQTDQVGGVNQSHESNTKQKLVKFRIRTKAISGDLGSPSKPKSLTTVNDPTCTGDDVRSRNTLSVGCNQGYSMQEIGEGSDRSSSLQLLHSGLKLNVNDEENPYKDTTDSDIMFNEAAADAVRRTRSMKMKATSQEQNGWNHNTKLRVEHALAGPSATEENFSSKAYNGIVSEEWMSSSKVRERSRSTRTKLGGGNENNVKFSSRRKPNPSVRKLSWLMLSEQEEGYRYIPQLGDEVVYFRQVCHACSEFFSVQTW